MIQKHVSPEQIAEYLHRRGNARNFSTEELRPLHKLSRSKCSLFWAREQIKRMLKNGIITSFKAETDEEYDTRCVRYRFSELKLKTWGL